jgi:hypothetical protein
VPGTGYHFVQWSDGLPTASRTDTNVQADITVSATFAINTYTLAYTTDGNGTLTGATTQLNVPYGTDGTAVTAVPNAGYNFDHWSDGPTTNPRTDIAVTADVSAMAVFVPETQLVFTVDPNTVVAGDTVTTAQVSVEDASFRVVPSDSTTQISIVDSLCGTTLATATVTAGVAQFDGLGFRSTASNRHLHAISSPVLTSPDSAAFDVQANPDWVFWSGFESCIP